MRDLRAWMREMFDAADSFGFKSLSASTREINTNELIRENESLRREVDRLRGVVVEREGSIHRLTRLLNRISGG